MFEDWKDGRYRVTGCFAQRARGRMCRRAIERRVRSVKTLPAFAADGHAFDAAASAPDRLVFRRRPAGGFLQSPS